MAFDHTHLATLVALLRAGSFEKAARALHVTSSAVSQRIKLLEDQIGGLVVVRGTPLRATSLGEALYRHGLQIEHLDQEMAARLSGEAAAMPISIAVNADSLATWLPAALSAFGRRHKAPIEVFVDDQDHTSAWLRSGRVLGAITTDARPVQGCRVHPLGRMRYRANATAAFMRAYFPKGITAAAMEGAPVIAFNRKDLLHEQFLQQEGLHPPPAATHLLPSPAAIVAACRAGMGWAVNPETLVAKDLARRRLVDLLPGRSLTVPLFWQCWSMRAPTLGALTEVLRATATADAGCFASA